MITVKLKVDIETGNDAFQLDARGELAETLKEIAWRIESGSDGGKIFDKNGNTIGTFGTWIES